MQEQTIVEKLAQNVTKTEFTPAPPDPAAPSGHADIAVDFPLDELTQYKIHNFLGENYVHTDEATKTKVQFIYDQVATLVGDRDYGLVSAKIHEIERMIGSSHSDQRLYKLYTWLKLNNQHRNIEAEMKSLGY